MLYLKMCANFIRFGRDLSGDNVNCSRKKGDSPFCTFLTVRRIMNLIKVLYAIFSCMVTKRHHYKHFDSLLHYKHSDSLLHYKHSDSLLHYKHSDSLLHYKHFGSLLHYKHFDSLLHYKHSDSLLHYKHFGSLLQDISFAFFGFLVHIKSVIH